MRYLATMTELDTRLMTLSSIRAARCPWFGM